MGQLTSREMIFMAVVIVLGLIFFAGVCVAIFKIFKRLEVKDRAENERFKETQDDTLEP